MFEKGGWGIDSSALVALIQCCGGCVGWFGCQNCQNSTKSGTSTTYQGFLANPIAVCHTKLICLRRVDGG